MHMIVCPKSTSRNKRIIPANEEIATIFSYHEIVAVKDIIINSIYCASCTIVIVLSKKSFSFGFSNWFSQAVKIYNQIAKSFPTPGFRNFE